MLVLTKLSGVKAEKTLCEYKKETQECAKWQSETRKVVQKNEVLRADEAARHIEDRHKNEVALARQTSQLRDIQENARKRFVRKLNFIAALDNPDRSASRLERAGSIWIETDG